LQYNHAVPEPHVRTPRAEPREVVELRQLKVRQPELGDAVDLHIALLALQRRVQTRVPTTWVEVAPEWLKRQHEAGKPLLRFEDIALDWTDFRLVFRQTADVLRRFDALDPADYQAIQAMSRDGHALEPLVVRWFNATAAPDSGIAPDPSKPPASAEALDQVMALAMRPFLERCADVVQQRADFSTWTHAHCPLCGGEPEFAVLTSAGERVLICGRCTGRWRFDDTACPFCGNTDRSRLPSFSSRDGVYRLYACDACRRYIKAYDARRGGRPVMLAVDAVATLPLDAAAVQRGYTG
jgi:Protein involved in formate dehydrogenase formation